MNEFILYAAVVLGAYLVGSIPTGYLISRLYGVADIRNHGSGNIGATNVARSLGIRYFFIVLVLDAAKACLFLLLLSRFGIPESGLILGGIGLLAGNGFSFFLNFSGGKGVATCLGVLLALNPLLAATALSIFIPVLVLTKTMGVASAAAAVSLPLFAAFFLEQGPLMVYLASCMALALCYLHRENIGRYLNL